MQPFQHARAIDARQQRLAQRRTELAQDAGAQQEFAHVGRLAAQHVFGQVFGDGAAATGQALDEIGRVAGPVQRHRGQQQRRDPAFGRG
jgi:hypothetical protein